MRSSLITIHAQEAELARRQQPVTSGDDYLLLQPAYSLGCSVIVCDQTCEGHNQRDTYLVTQKPETFPDDSLGRAGRGDKNPPI